MLSQWFCRCGGFYSFHAVLVAPRGDFIITCAGFKSPLARFYHNLSRFFRRFTRALPCYKLIFASFADYGNIILRSMAFFNRLFRRRGRVFHPHCSENRAPTICDHIKTRRSPISLRRVSYSLKLHPLFARISPFDSSITESARYYFKIKCAASVLPRHSEEHSTAPPKGLYCATWNPRHGANS